jgi:hypothetical protein
MELVNTENVVETRRILESMGFTLDVWVKGEAFEMVSVALNWKEFRMLSKNLNIGLELLIEEIMDDLNGKMDDYLKRI